MSYETTIRFDEPDQDTQLLTNLESKLFRSESRSSECLHENGLLSSVFGVLRGEIKGPREQVAKLLGDASRDGWRVPFGEVGLIQFCLDLLQRELPTDVTKHCLRFIANSCADTDSNRNILVENRATNILQHFLGSNRKLSTVSIVALFNLCVDFGEGKDSCGDTAANTLLTLANSPVIESDEYSSLIHTSAALLEDLRFQKFMVHSGAVEIPLAVLAQSYNRFSDPNSQEDGEDASSLDIQTLRGLRNTLIVSMSEVSAADNFVDVYNLDSPLVGSLLEWLNMNEVELQVCAAIMLGNIARNEVICRQLVYEKGVHLPLIHILGTKSDVGVLHAVGGMLKNLALSGKDVREVIANAGALEACDKLYQPDMPPQVSYTGVSLMRMLLKDSLHNLSSFLAPLSSDPDSPAANKTHLSLLLDLFPESNDTPTRTEIGRVVVSILRIIYSSKQVVNTSSSISPMQLEANPDKLETRLFDIHESIGRPIVEFIKQDKWPALRSEGWFALANMARSKMGAERASYEVVHPKCFEAMFTALGRREEWDSLLSHLEIFEGTEKVADDNENALSNTDGHRSEANVTNPQDRDNVLIFISELLRNYGDKIAWLRKSVFQNILEGKSLATIIGSENSQESFDQAFGTDDGNDDNL